MGGALENHQRGHRGRFCQAKTDGFPVALGYRWAFRAA